MIHVCQMVSATTPASPASEMPTSTVAQVVSPTPACDMMTTLRTVTVMKAIIPSLAQITACRTSSTIATISVGHAQKVNRRTARPVKKELSYTQIPTCIQGNAYARMATMPTLTLPTARKSAPLGVSPALLATRAHAQRVARAMCLRSSIQRSHQHVSQ